MKQPGFFVLGLEVRAKHLTIWFFKIGVDRSTLAKDIFQIFINWGKSYAELAVFNLIAIIFVKAPEEQLQLSWSVSNSQTFLNELFDFSIGNGSFAVHVY